MLRQLRTIGCLAALVSLSFAESPGDKCSKDGDMLGIVNDCKEYLICEKGQYVSKSCGFWQEFDIKYNECRWSPLATCRQKTLEGTVLADVTEMICSSSSPCKSKDTTGVEGECHYYCPCKDGVFKQPEKCLMDNYYDPIRKVCTPDSTVCRNTPTTQKPTTATGSEPTTVTGSEPTTATGSEPTTVTGSEPTTVTGSEPPTSAASTVAPPSTSPPVSECTPGKKLPNPANCQKYYECTTSKDKKTNKWEQKKCWPLTYFDTEKERCAINIATSSVPWIYRPCQ